MLRNSRLARDRLIPRIRLVLKRLIRPAAPQQSEERLVKSHCRLNDIVHEVVHCKKRPLSRPRRLQTAVLADHRQHRAAVDLFPANQHAAMVSPGPRIPRTRYPIRTTRICILAMRGLDARAGNSLPMIWQQFPFERPRMSLVNGTLGALLGAAVGAAVWTGISWLTGWNLGILAPIVGGAAGFGMGMGNQGRGGATAGIIAAALTIAGVLASRCMLSELEYSDFADEMATISEEDAQDRLAWEVMDRMISNGETLSESDDDESFPPEVESQAAQLWDQMDDQERAEFIAAMTDESRAMTDDAAGVGTFIFFLLNMGLFGWIFTALAAGTAFRIASTEIRHAQSEPHSWNAPRPAALPVPVADDTGGGYFARLGRLADVDPLEGRAATGPTADKHEAA